MERARRSQFIECALEALAELGFTGTTIAEVARRAEVSKSVVLYHFGSKQELLEAVVEEVYAGAAPDLLAAMEAAQGHRGKLDAYLHGCVMFAWANQRRLAGVGEIFRNLRKADGQLRYSHADSEALISWVEQMILDGQQAGEFGPVDARTAAVMIRATIDALPGVFAAEPGADALAFSARLRDLVGRMVARDVAP
ncbi:TetR/AcrR family transcriptional regulator [Brevibacterium picturae]|uniref:TetR/AcrR family transcriptional regulator n=1 Tax=Brevibacterium picturae TaxID=260553 RepID=A0ABP4NCL8_9MICO